jgi:hypothetical protein
MFQRKAFLHWYTAEGMEEMQFIGKPIGDRRMHLLTPVFPLQRLKPT